MAIHPETCFSAAYSGRIQLSHDLSSFSFFASADVLDSKQL